MTADSTSMIGAYGPWAAKLAGDGPGRLSLRRELPNDLEAWQRDARARVLTCMAPPELNSPPGVEATRVTTAEGLQVEELQWRLPAGPPTRALLIKPEGATGPLPGVLALHDHGGLKTFGWERIAKGSEDTHALARAYIDRAYGGRFWANELARRGYVVLAYDAFAFGSRRVRLADVSSRIRSDPLDEEQTVSDDISTVAGAERYNRWAAMHESIMAKSLLSAGTTWPGVTLAEDRVALDILCARPDVDPTRVGCGGLSAGGLRTVHLGGLEPRIRCAVCVGMMTTWRDFLLNKSVNHTWMIYIPHIAHELDYPEILALRAPLPTLVQNNRQDPLFTLVEMERADTIMREIYARIGASERYRSGFYPGPHKFDIAMQQDAFDWFDRWLK